MAEHYLFKVCFVASMAVFNVTDDYGRRMFYG